MRLFRLVCIVCMLLCSSIINSAEAQVKSGDTLELQTAHTVRAKPKKIKKRRAVYKLEARSVSDALGLSKQQSDTLEVVYREARKSRKLELTKIPYKDDKESYKTKAQEVNSKERDRLKVCLKGFLPEDKVSEAMLPLGSFNPLWDNYVYTLADLKLDKGKMDSALFMVYKYIVEYEKVKKSARAVRNKSSLKRSLDVGLSKLLTREQLTIWSETTNIKNGNVNKNRKK